MLSPVYLSSCYLIIAHAHCLFFGEGGYFGLFYDTIDGYRTNECMICTIFTSRQHDTSTYKGSSLDIMCLRGSQVIMLMMSRQYTKCTKYGETLAIGLSDYDCMYYIEDGIGHNRSFNYASVPLSVSPGDCTTH